MKPTITQERLKEFLHYDPDTGVFTWLIPRGKGRISVGTIAGTPHSRGYIAVKVDGKRYLAHRLAWLYMVGSWPKEQIDHLNCIRTDNRISNLRDVAGSVNQQNQRRAQSGNSTGLLGVSFYKAYKKFRSEIRVSGRTRSLGYFDTAPEAHAAYLKAKRELHAGCTL